MVHDNGRKRTVAGNGSTLYGNTFGSGRSSCHATCINKGMLEVLLYFHCHGSAVKIAKEYRLKLF